MLQPCTFDFPKALPVIAALYICCCTLIILMCSNVSQMLYKLCFHSVRVLLLPSCTCWSVTRVVDFVDGTGTITPLFSQLASLLDSLQITWTLLVTKQY
jgi:hypothetical protein